MVADRVGGILGNYTLVRVLGQGSFAEVYLGEHRYLERPAAIKVLHIHMELKTQDAFRREAHTIARLDHPHIVRVHDFGIQEQTPYLVMEYTPNGTLRERYPKGTCLTVEQIVSFVKQIASALDYAHGQGIIHRDVKPENLLLNAKHEIVLSDFGIAVVQQTQASLSSQNMAGTPLYMAPEQIQQHPCPASDQYALGVLVYEWLCGEPPFPGPGMAVFAQHLYQAPPSLRARLPHLPLAVEDAVFGALAKNPAQRFTTVQEFAIMLEKSCFATRPLSLQASIQPVSFPLPRSALVPALEELGQDDSDEATQPRLLTLSHAGAQLVSRPTTHPAPFNAPVVAQAKTSLAHKNRQILLHRVRSYWIEGVLEHSLHGAALMTLGLQAQPNVVANPWHLVLQQPETPPHPLPAGTPITKVYDAADGELLILGAPGAGKTTLLLELARNLLVRAEQDEQHPIPVVFNLSSWAGKQQSLVQWLVEELNTKYQVPTKLGQALVETDHILPLLDGLDEIAPATRTTCIETINIYRHDHGLLPLVVCSRQADYLAQSARLLVRSAVAVQPLLQEQVNAYLAQGGEPLWALRVALHQDVTLRELTSTPLMLSILTLTYYGKPVEEMLQGTSREERQRHIFQQYIERMLTRRGPLKAGTALQVTQWLTFLATRMREHNQTAFYLEPMQPDWLPPAQYHSYGWFAVRLPALLVGILAGFIVSLVLDFPLSKFFLLIGAIGGLLGWLFSRPISDPEGAIDNQHNKCRYLLRKALPFSILVGLIVKLSFGLILQQDGPQGWLYNYDGSIWGTMMGLSSLLLSWLLPSHASQPATAPKTNKTTRQWTSPLVHLIQTRHMQRVLCVIAIVGVSYGLSTGLTNGSINELNDVLSLGLDSGLKFGLISILVSLILEAHAGGISLTEHLRWTRKSLMKSLFAPKHVRTAFLIASLITVIAWLSTELNSSSLVVLSGLPSFKIITGLSTGLLYWILLGLFQGVSGEQIEDHARRVPNQGIRRSLHNSILMALICGAIIAGVSMLSYWLRVWLGTEWVIIGQGIQIEGLSAWQRGRLFSGLFTSLLIGVCGGLLISTAFGGLAALRHGILRLLLRQAGVVPRHYVRFLDEATNCILLQKVGGGYSFVHRLLLDYFAEREQYHPDLLLSLVEKPQTEDLTTLSPEYPEKMPGRE